MLNDVILNDLKDKFIKFAKEYHLRDDWHEPDELEVDAYVEGNHLDNAMGDTGYCGELIVVLTVNEQPMLRLNLATLLAVACQ